MSSSTLIRAGAHRHFPLPLTTGPPYMTMKKAFNPSNWFCKDKPERLGNYVTRCKDRVTKGPCHKSELEAMEYIKAHTQIPIPHVRNVREEEAGLFIEMDYVPGQTLGEAWSSGKLSATQRQRYLRELAGYIEQLRSLKAPKEDTVASADGGSFVDTRICDTPVGPFTHASFHSLLRGHCPLDQTTATFGMPVTRCHSKTYATKFTHGDLALRNIIVRDGRVAAILDWGCAGWFPEYYEYTKAHFSTPFPIDFYEGYRKSVKLRYDEELEAETALWDRLEPPLLW